MFQLQPRPQHEPSTSHPQTKDPDTAYRRSFSGIAMSQHLGRLGRRGGALGGGLSDEVEGPAVHRTSERQRSFPDTTRLGLPGRTSDQLGWCFGGSIDQSDMAVPDVS